MNLLQIKKFIFVGSALVGLNLFGSGYELIDISKITGENVVYATSINDSSYVCGVISPLKMWYIWSEVEGLIHYPINLLSAFSGPGCPPYFDEHGKLTSLSVNTHGQFLTVKQGNLYLNGKNSSSFELVDDEDIWSSQEGGLYLRINDNFEIVGPVNLKNGKYGIKFIDLKNKEKFLLDFKYSITPIAMNNSGDVVGSFYANDKFNTVLWSPGKKWQIIENFRASSINDNGIIVGSSQGKGAFWKNGIIKIIDNLLDLFVDNYFDIETIELISDINNLNEMVGNGKVGHVTRAVFIKPTY